MSQDLAYEHNGARISRERFYEIACDPRRSVAVEACAGAGKTWMLVSRMVRALLSGSQPQDILAITFTKKAAGEMRERLAQWLEEFAHCPDQDLAKALVQRGIASPRPEELEALRGLYSKMLASGRPVQIRTFHSWFAALLRNAPLAVLEQLRLPSHYELLEDDKDAIELVWRRFHAAVAADASARSDFEASVAAHGRFNTQKALGAALARRVEFALADVNGIVAASVRPFAEQFPEFAGMQEPCDALTRVPGVRDELLAAARALGRASAPTFSAKGVELERAVTEGDLDATFGAMLTKAGEPRKFSDKIAGIEQVRSAQELVLRLAAACTQHEGWLHHGRMTRLTRVLIQEYGALKRERGWVDMNDVEQAAFSLLSDPVLSGWVQERLDARTRHLLIDEFQDTNPLQWQALHAWLEGYAGAGERPGVFIVGDPKQSIYRFRRAEPQVFRAAKEFLGEAFSGDVLSCDHTHRNAPEVIAVVNEVMAAAQAADEFEGFRLHTTEARLSGWAAALPPVPRAAKAAPADQALEWRDSLATPRELPEEKLVTLECRQAAAWIASQVAEGVPPADIMVLARRRDRLSALDAELRLLHIPADQPEKTDLCDAPEVQDITALLDALVSPTHDLSLARALKSPLFGLGDDLLVELAVASRAARDAKLAVTWFELLQRRTGEEGPVGEAARLLGEWKRLIDRFPPHDVLDVIFAKGDVLARFGAAAPAPLRDMVLARLRALLSAALQVDGGRYATPYAFVRALKAGGIKAPAAVQPQAVRLLTVHGAKGLQAPIVLLLDTDAVAARAESMGVLVDWPGEAPSPWRFAFVASETRPPPCCVEALEIERAARHREELNVLYVALTRAQEGIVISSVEPHGGNPGSWWQRLLPLCMHINVPTPAQVVPPKAVVTFALPELPQLTAIGTANEAPEPDSEQSRFGQAVHRLLEGWVPGGEFGAAHLRSVAREFRLDGALGQEAAKTAQRILTGEGAWAWDRQQVQWQGNEVPLHHEGESLRIDRLVRRASSGEWWVFDFKSSFRPEGQEELLAQMRRYRAAVRVAYPGSAVNAAFLTGQGKMIIVPD